ncbi:GNAT family N-acetyltransferase [Bacillus sp. FJAT-49732]|uniref:GNAT family N-acetyltransferase n=1 Tax=Lederbergia citrisecunda TaxID=2833583 RepID=A0A942YJE9_9BACI|nr:GNAT family N-acetyltransferase [Lederbergia citrisecunda]MBS4198542.1 GNAT family N-acetyltransferase [Lederbergia citrisecunda]
MDISYFTDLPDNEIMTGILQIHEGIFQDSSIMVKKMENKRNLLIHVASINSKVVGYKIGYEISNEKFYSWLGGVDTTFRNLGIATKLMEKQHQYLIDKGYKIVQTKTKNKWRQMLILNIKNGFNIMDTYIDKNGEIKIILEKNL